MPISTFLDGRAPSQLRGLAWLSLSDQGRFLSTAGSDDGGGGIRGSFVAGSYMPCRVDPMGARGAVTAEQIDERSTHLITCPPQTTANTTGRFEIQNGGTYEITAVRTRTGEWVRELEAVEA